MENLLIEIYLFVCQSYDTSSATCYQRLSNNREPEFTDQELITIWFFAHLEGCFEKKRMHRLIEKYWREWLSHLPCPRTRMTGTESMSRSFAAATWHAWVVSNSSMSNSKAKAGASSFRRQLTL